MRLIYHSTKTYGHDIGLSCAFRQWKADSHCNKLHGYALSVHLDFAAVQLDDRNWVVDFGSLKPLKAQLADFFDHKTIVAADDPHLAYFREGERLGVLDLIVTDTLGCERFAETIAVWTENWLTSNELRHRVRLATVEVKEHCGNSAYVEVIDGRSDASS